MSEDQLQPDDTLDDRGVEDVLDEGYSPPEREPAHLRRPEEAEEETLDERLEDEEPEVWADEPAPDVVPDPDAEPEDDVVHDAGEERTGRLGEGETDIEAEDEGIDGAGASAEEAAVHTLDDENPV